MIRRFLVQCQQDYFSLLHDLAGVRRAFIARRMERRATRLESKKRAKEYARVSALCLVIMIVACIWRVVEMGWEIAMRLPILR
jgi:hypothetical protein